MIPRIFFVFFCVTLIFLGGCATGQRAGGAPEIKEGNIYLTLHEKSGGFTMSYLANPDRMRYEPLFDFGTPSSSYVSVSVDGKVYKLNDKIFKKSVNITDGYPSYKFESPSLSVTQAFTPVKTPSSSVVNGIKITFTIANTGGTDQNVGLRMLLDTNLGEGRGNVPFILGGKDITNETISEDSDRYWISRNDKISLMGSIVIPQSEGAAVPDYVHFADWRRFYNTAWSFDHSPGRTFDSDSAVCYFFEPSVLSDLLIFSIILSAQDVEWYNMDADKEESFYLQPAVYDDEDVQAQTPVQQTPAPDVNNRENEQPVNTRTQSEINITPPVNTRAQSENNITPPGITEAQSDSEDDTVNILIALQGLLNQFIKGEIELSEQDLLEIESAINRLR